MLRIFNVDSPLYRFLVRFWDMIKLNFLWVLFSLPIVTIGPSTIAAYTITLKMVDEKEGHIMTDFVKAFKENLKQGIPLGLISIIVPYLAYLNFEFFNKIESNPILFLIAAMIITFFGLVYLTYAFPLSARYHNTLIKTLQNSAAISIKYFLRTLLLWLVLGVLMIVFLFNTTLMFIGLLIGPVSLFLTISGFANKCFKDIEDKNKTFNG